MADSDRKPKDDGGQIGGFLSLRDYFAGLALLKALQHEMELRRTSINPGEFRHEAVAHAAYVMADCMLAERAK